MIVLTTIHLHATELYIQAAVSLKDVLTDVGHLYEQQSGDQLLFNFSASSLLKRQIEEGAPADVFISADTAKMDDLQAHSLLINESRLNLVSNSLVIVIPSDSSLSIRQPQDLLTHKIKHIAIAEPQSVPAGIYARAFLQKINLWPALQNKLVPTENARVTLVAVESGNAAAGIVYKTDALTSKKVTVIYQVPPNDVPPIFYPMALLRNSRHPQTARKFMDYLTSGLVLKIFEKYGFVSIKHGQ